MFNVNLSPSASDHHSWCFGSLMLTRDTGIHQSLLCYLPSKFGQSAMRSYQSTPRRPRIAPSGQSEMENDRDPCFFFRPQCAQLDRPTDF